MNHSGARGPQTRRGIGVTHCWGPTPSGNPSGSTTLGRHYIPLIPSPTQPMTNSMNVRSPSWSWVGCNLQGAQGGVSGES
jgi:hypothetical protein